MTARIDSYQLTMTQEKIEKINARAEKHGLSGRLALDVTEVEVKSKDDMGFEVVEIMYDVEFTGEAPKHNGWVFLATLDWDDNAGLVVRTAPGVHSVDREGLRAGWCDHCKKQRMRKETFLVKHEETGEEKQIGRSCIKDFLGWSTTVHWPSSPADEDEEREFFGPAGERDVSTETVLAYAWAVIKCFGFVRAQDYHATPTKHMVSNAIFPGKGRRDREFADKMRPLAKEAKERAQEIRAFILSDDFSGTSEYVLNLKSIATANAVSHRNWGILVSAPQAWARFNEQTLLRKAKEEKPSEWIGTAPDKDKGIKGSRITFTGIVESIRWTDGLYGSTTIYQVRDELSGVIVKWFASTDGLGERKGVRVTFRGTVKAHDEYKGIKSTVLTRCTLVESDVTEPKPFEIDVPKKRTPRKKPAPAPVEETVSEPEIVEEPAPVVEEQPQAEIRRETTPEIPQQAAPESSPEPVVTSLRNPLWNFEGGSVGMAERFKPDFDPDFDLIAHLRDLYVWVRLGDDVERMNLADAYDLLGQAYAESAEWVGGHGWAAAQWGGLLLAVGSDGDAPTV
jgi:hypothetical protein